MITACWAAKGGSGTTVVASCLALLAAPEPAGALLVDLAGDAPAALGIPDADTPGLAGWLAAGVDVPADALSRLEIEVAPGLALIPRGRGRLDPGRIPVLATLLDHSPRPTVADCGSGLRGAAEAMARVATRSLLVTRPCYLALRRIARLEHRPDAVVLVREPGRSLGRSDVERVVGAPVVTEVEVDPAIARAVDAGLVTAPRLPRALEKALRSVS